ncbi:hypothetical protein HDE69_004600 [Pedobacter cryoconitis]|uniref:Uncharacterized protein n=1 Tax=Pedobacter cryoconitis TaxID=188932 RepID=A0A7W9DM34_9SPHI|nr:hypothetical protein [Pedobacter cryoconitis]MBB5623514.1 hypothetical protein [Pedobacter cryoconitis]MBB5645343.1 hypothetical protein [Pedobacter cryoconitis]
MKLELIWFVLGSAYWIYLIDPFCSRPLKRNYLRLYKETKFLCFSLLLSVILLISGCILTATYALIPFSILPILFIVIDLLLIKVSILHLGRPFIFIHRGDLVKVSLANRLYSAALILLPFLLSFILGYQIIIS